MFQLQEYLLNQIPPEKLKQYGLDKLLEKTNCVVDLSKNIIDPKTKNTVISTNFHLPITYLDSKEIHPLSPIVSSDLELLRPDSEFSVYENLFLPSNTFGRNIIPAWSKQFTTNVSFLKDSQNILYNIQNIKDKYRNNNNNDTIEEPKYDKIMEIWNDIKEDSSFLEKYGYME